MKRVKRSHAGRIAVLVGEGETDAYVALQRGYGKLVASTGERFFGGGGIELLEPAEVVELGEEFRPGLVAFARELAGDWVCWDLRKGRPADGTSPRVVYVDHELGVAEVFARDVSGAVVHMMARATVGVPASELAPSASRWIEVFGRTVGSRDREAIALLVERVSKSGRRPAFEKLDDAKRALGKLIPSGKGGWSTLPSAHFPLLAPDDPRCIDEAVLSYEASAAAYRELVHDERRHTYAWHLAATLRGLSDLLLRRGKYARAAKAAQEAIEQYEPLHAKGDQRVATQLAFVHHVVSAVEARGRRWPSAYEHADRALVLSEAALLDYAGGVRALGFATDAWERERAGEDSHEVQIRLNVAVKETAAFANRIPPHPLGDDAARIARLAKGKRAKGLPRT